MKTSRTSPVQYAVIQVRESDAGMERCVIGYRDERALRRLLAKRSIVATGFSSRDEATKRSFTAGTGNRGPFLKVVSGVRPSPGFCQLRMLKVRTLSRLQGVGALKVNNLVHIARFALYIIRTRLTHTRRRLEPAVQ